MGDVNYKAEVLDVSGRVIYTNDAITTDQFTIDLTGSANGTYMLQMSTETMKVTKRIVVKK